MTRVPDTCHIGTRRVETPAAALFDVDGTLVDSMGRFFPSWNEAGADYGLSMTEAEFYGYAGMPLPDIVEDLYRRCKGTEPPDGFVAEFVGLTVVGACLDPGAGHPVGEAFRVVIASSVFALEYWLASEFASPNH